eukprot:10272702-Ditylum_brightwellii.AAC.1
MAVVEHNANVLCTFQFDVKSYIHSQDDTTVSYGSEFRPVAELDTLLSHHSNWPSLCNNIDLGIDYPLTAIDNDTRVQQLHQAQERGNHKSVRRLANKE